MEAEVVLREIAAAANDFAELGQVAGGHANAGVQGEAIAAHAFELKADPVVGGNRLPGAGSWADRRGFRRPPQDGRR